MVPERSERWSSPKNLGKKTWFGIQMTNLYMFVVFIKNPKKHEREWTTECTTHGQGGTRLTIPQPHPHVQKAPLLVGESIAMRCDITCLWGGHNCWEFGGDTADVSLQKLKPFCLRHVGPSGITAWIAVHTDQRAAVRLIGVVLWFIMKTLNLYRFLNSCPN